VHTKDSLHGIGIASDPTGAPGPDSPVASAGLQYLMRPPR
jgi:hypothetical protein